MDVLLGIVGLLQKACAGHAAVAAHGVQFHQLAGIVLIGVGAVAVGIAEKIEHGWAFGAGPDQVAKIAQCVGANHVLVFPVLERALKVGLEVIGPEIDHELKQLSPAAQGARVGHRPQMALQVSVGPATGGHAGRTIDLQLGQRGRWQRHSQPFCVRARQTGHIALTLAVVYGLDSALCVDEGCQVKTGLVCDVVRPHAKSQPAVGQPGQRRRCSGRDGLLRCSHHCSWFQRRTAGKKRVSRNSTSTPA